MKTDLKTDRRQILKVLGATPALAFAQTATQPPAGQNPIPEEKAKTPARPGAAAPITKAKSFTPKEWRTIHVLCDLILPADARSGSATAAGVPAYIDEVMTDRTPKADQQRFVALIHGGLAWLDMESRRRFDKEFAAAAVAQQKEILDLIAYPKRAATEHAAQVSFFNRFRDLVAAGFFSSKMGIDDLGYKGNRFVQHWDGCPPEVLAQLGL